MPRTKAGSIPSYRQHKSTGQAVVTINSRDVYLGRFDTPESKAEYARVITEFALTGDYRPKDAATPDEPTLVCEILAGYWTHAQAYYVKDGKPTDEQKAVRKVIRDLSIFGDLPANEVGPKLLKAVRQVWIDQDLCRKYINQNVGRVRRMFKWAVSEEMVASSVLESLRSVAGLAKGRSLARESVLVPPVEIGVVERTIPHLSNVVADMIRFQLLTGARPGEVCKLSPGNIDRTGDVWEYRVDGHKMEHHGRDRIVYIGPEAKAVLAPYLLRDPQSPCFSPRESIEQLRQRRSAGRTTPPSCGNARGRKHDAGGLRGDAATWKPRDAFTAGTYGQAIKRGCDLAFPPPEPLGRRNGETIAQHAKRLTKAQAEELAQWRKLQRWAPNQLRHTRATEVRKRYGLEAAQVILGHAAASVTQIYAERDAEKAREVARSSG